MSQRKNSQRVNGSVKVQVSLLDKT